MAASTPYPFSLSIDPYRPISSYFPLASTSHSHSPPPANERQQRQPPTSPEPFVDARHVDQASRSASYKRPSSSPHRARHDEPAALGKRPRMRPALEPVGSAFEDQAASASSEHVIQSREVVNGDGNGRAADSSTRPHAPPAHERQVEQRAPPHRRRSSAPYDPELALPDEFSPGALKPKLAGLRFDYYKPYLLDEPVAPAWSSTFCEAFIAFAMSVAPPPLWSGRPDRLRVDDDSPGILRDIRSREPDAEAFRRRAPLNRSRAAERAAPDLMAKLVAMLDVMRWIWDDDSLELEHVAGMILTAPLAVFMIIRTLAATQRYSILRRIAEEDLVRYLSRHRSPSFRERAALVLLSWFARADAPLVRKYRFFVDRRGLPRRGRAGEGMWEAWLAPPGPGGIERSERELDEWEVDVVRREGWPE